MGRSQFSWTGKHDNYVILIGKDPMEPGEVVEYLQQREDFLNQADRSQETINKLRAEINDGKD